MKFRKIGALVASDHILSLTWAGDALVVTPVTGAIIVTNRDASASTELPAHGMGNGASGAAHDVLATCGFDGKIRLHSLADPAAEPQTIALGKGWVEQVAWSPNGKNFATALGKTLFIFDREGRQLHAYPDHQTSVSDFAWNPKKNSEIATVCGGGAQMYRLGKPRPFANFEWGGASLTVQWSPGGRWLVTGDQTPSVHLYDFTRDYPLHIQGFEAKVKAMDFTPDGRRLATGGSPLITVWDCTGPTGPEGTTPGQWQFHKGDVEALAWSPDGAILASGDLTGRLVLSDSEGEPFAAFESPDGVTALSWNPTGQHLAVGDASGTVVVFARGE